MQESNKALEILETAECNPVQGAEIVDEEKKGVLKIFDDSKDVVEKGLDVVGNAAKTAVGFSGDQLKRAKDVMDKAADKSENRKNDWSKLEEFFRSAVL